MWVTFAGWQVGAVEALDPVHDDVDRSVAGLEAAGGEDERLRAHRQAEAVVHRRRDDQVDRPVLVLEQHERHALGGRGPLAGDHEAGHSHAAGVRVGLEVRCSC